MGAVAERIMGNAIGQMASYVLNLGLGMRPEFIGHVSRTGPTSG